MRDNHHRARPRIQEGFQLLKGIDIKVVRGLIEKQHVRLRHKHTGQLQSAALTSGQITHWSALALGGKSQAFRQLRSTEFLLSQMHIGGDVLDGVEKPAFWVEVIKLLPQPTKAHGFTFETLTRGQLHLTCERPQQRCLT